VVEPDGRTNKKLRTADNEQPYGGHLQRMIEKKILPRVNHRAIRKSLMMLAALY
jgi:hypothetical protein